MTATSAPILPWHGSLWQQLDQAIAQQRMAHGILITGPVGVGKKVFAQRLAQRLLCHKPSANAACGQCDGCLQWQSQTHPDVSFLAPESEGGIIKVGAMREFCARLQLTSQYQAGRLGWIAPADNMNAAAANSLLKTLEEPPQGTHLILISHNVSQLLPTIRSRCSTLRVPPADPDTAGLWLSEQGITADTIDDDRLRTPFKVIHQQKQQVADDKLAPEKWPLQLAKVLAGRADSVAAAKYWAQQPADLWSQWFYRSACQLLEYKLKGQGADTPLQKVAQALSYHKLQTLSQQASRLCMLERSNADWQLQIEDALIQTQNA